jgi:hypothetical protein
LEHRLVSDAEGRGELPQGRLPALPQTLGLVVVRDPSRLGLLQPRLELLEEAGVVCLFTLGEVRPLAPAGHLAFTAGLPGSQGPHSLEPGRDHRQLPAAGVELPDHDLPRGFALAET